MYGSVFLVATGVGVVIVGFMGIVAALRESRIIATMVRNFTPPGNIQWNPLSRPPLM